MKSTKPSEAGTAKSARGGRRRLRANKVSDEVAIAIVSEIVSRGLPPGTRLPSEIEMLEQFGVGRNSMREGLRVLETYGVIAIRPGSNGGPVVADLSPGDLGRALSLFFHLRGATYENLIDARLVLEPVMARIAAERQDPDQLQQMTEVLEHEESIGSDEECADDYFSAANDFHYAICGASGNPILDMIGQALRTFYVPLHMRNRETFSVTSEAARRVHKQIGDAIVRGDSARAESLMAEHMADLGKFQRDQNPGAVTERVHWET
jgi:GntR family transcriptional repressor for pyruvate dehydrogenase complex